MLDLTTIATPTPVVPRTPVAVRTATMDDLPFLDALQKQHNKALGFFPRAQMEGYVKGGWVLVAEEAGSRQRAAGSEEIADGAPSSSLPTARCPLPTRLGYCISRDRYLKRDELGVVYQLCVVPGLQRRLIGAALIRGVFERSAYGCKLYCCWCAQDLAANYFWESLGFVPIAFRAGSSGKRRVHIFWQRRINADDVSTPYWYPCQTNGGAIRADRLVFPIPPGVHWRDIRPADLQALAMPVREVPKIRGDIDPRVAPRKRRPEPIAKPANVPLGGFQFQAEQPAAPVKAKRRRAAEKPPAKIDPKLIAATRELRDRYLERVNAEPGALSGCGKYAVSRTLAAPRAEDAGRRALLEAA